MSAGVITTSKRLSKTNCEPAVGGGEIGGVNGRRVDPCDTPVETLSGWGDISLGEVVPEPTVFARPRLRRTFSGATKGKT